MRFISFVSDGQSGFGALTEDDTVMDLRPILGVASLVEAIERRILPRTLPTTAVSALALSDLTLLPVIPRPAKILCIGLNYETHRAETKRAESLYPTVFTRYADSQVAHGQAIIRPKVSDQLDFEGELAVVIGAGGRYIAEDEAMSHVAGYSCYNEATIRDFQRHTHQFTPGKTFPGTGAFGPAMTDAADVADYRPLRIRTLLNGEVMQDATLGDMIFPIARLISYCSTFTPLAAGDVIVTGTPGGVGDRREPRVFMKAGDEVEVEIEGIGRLVNPVADEA